MSQVTTQISELKLVPVVAIESEEHAVPLAEALTEGGLPCAEITLRTGAALKAIGQLGNRAGFLVGAGTVHSITQAKQVLDAGAKFFEATHRQDFEILDRVGGRDRFASGLKLGRMTTGDPQAAVEYGAAPAALAVTTAGDTSISTQQEVERLVQHGGARVVR